MRCGFKVRLNTMSKEWSGLRVCKPCRDPKPADQRPPKVKPEGVPVPNAAPATVPMDRADYGFAPGEDL